MRRLAFAVLFALGACGHQATGDDPGNGGGPTTPLATSPKAPLTADDVTLPDDYRPDIEAKFGREGADTIWKISADAAREVYKLPECRELVISQPINLGLREDGSGTILADKPEQAIILVMCQNENKEEIRKYYRSSDGLSLSLRRSNDSVDTLGSKCLDLGVSQSLFPKVDRRDRSLYGWSGRFYDPIQNWQIIAKAVSPDGASITHVRCDFFPNGELFSIEPYGGINLESQSQ